MKQTFDAVVVGAGYIGCSVAYYLSAAGLKTALLDQGTVAAGASRANYGNIQVQDCETQHSIPMITTGYQMFENLEKELECSVGLRRFGGLLVIEKESQVDMVKDRQQALLNAGIKSDLLMGKEVTEVEPLLDSRNLVGALYNPDEGQVYPFSLMWGYVQRARRLGLQLYTHSEVTGFTTHGGRINGVQTSKGNFSTGTVILCTGAWSQPLGKLLGYTWDIGFVQGQAILTEPVNTFLTGHLSSASFFETISDHSVDSSPSATMAIAQSMHGHFMLGESSEKRTDYSSTLPTHSHSVIAKETGRFLPVLNSLRIMRGWAAPVAHTSDGMPYLGPVSGTDGLYMATAFRSTVISTPFAGKMISQLVTSGKSELDLSPFSPDRAAD
jgi:sarcosine oxidase, subunit beta